MHTPLTPASVYWMTSEAEAMLTTPIRKVARANGLTLANTTGTSDSTLVVQMRTSTGSMMQSMVWSSG